MALKTGMKTCTGCKKTKCFNEFYVNKNSKCMYRTECKTCHSAKNKQNYKKNKEKIAQNYKKNKDKIKTRSKEYNKINKEKVAKQKKIYREKNKEKIAVKNKEYEKNNK